MLAGAEGMEASKADDLFPVDWSNDGVRCFEVDWYIYNTMSTLRKKDIAL